MVIVCEIGGRERNFLMESWNDMWTFPSRMCSRWWGGQAGLSLIIKGRLSFSSTNPKRAFTRRFDTLLSLFLFVFLNSRLSSFRFLFCFKRGLREKLYCNVCSFSMSHFRWRAVWRSICTITSMLKSYREQLPASRMQSTIWPGLICSAVWYVQTLTWWCHRRRKKNFQSVNCKTTLVINDLNQFSQNLSEENWNLEIKEKRGK